MKNNKLNLPQRSQKPRQSGITSIMDIDLPLAQQQQILESYSDLIDLAKLGTGAAYVNPVLKEKITLYQSFNIPVYLGGTLFEKFYQQDKINTYRDYLLELDLTHVEVSSGILDIPQGILLEIVADFRRDFTVLAEVGKKFCHACPTAWIDEIVQFIDAGVSYVVLEGRGSADAGIYNSQGVLERTLIDQIANKTNINHLLLEAPTPQSQIQLIQALGTNVNLGNISMLNVMGLEALRMGLRADTFNI